MSLHYSLVACLLAAGSGAPALILPRRWMLGQIVAVVLMVAAGLIGIAAALGGVWSPPGPPLTLPGPVPQWTFHLSLDPLSAFFLVPIFLIGMAGSIYGLGYWRQAEHLRNGRKVSLCYGVLIAGLAMVTLAADAITFLFAWEIMALAAFFLVSAEDHKPEARRAGWVYLVATHIGTLVLFALFALLYSAAGSFELRKLQPGQVSGAWQAVIFLTALVGFGFKAGIMPLHFWLPDAHANSPSHVSAVMSGIVLKIGIYGLVRAVTLLPGLPTACGFLVLVLGVVSAVFGVVFALGQHDLKRLLAYHSIENIGIILMGLGLAMIGTAVGRVEWVILGMSGCLLHVWNHAMFKALLFMAAGSVVHAVHTREIDRLGGLAKRMPRTALMFAVGAVAICGLPPLNGFISELLIYLGLLRTATAEAGPLPAAAFAAPALAMVGALAVACFVKAYGSVFLGEARSDAASHAQEAPLSMMLPMTLLATLCIAIGVFPMLVLPVLDRVLVQFSAAPMPRLADLFPQALVTSLALAMVIAAATGGILLRRRFRRGSVPTAGTWDCGYVRPSARMQYTSSSFANMLVGLFRWALRPRIYGTRLGGLFPGRSSFESHVPDVVLDGALSPWWGRIKSYLASARILQQGSVQQYLMYILLALFGLLLSLVPVAEWTQKLLGR